LKNTNKTKQDVIAELEELPQRIATALQPETDKKPVEEVLSIVYDALNSSVNGVIITDLEGHIKYANPAFLKIFEYDDSFQIVGKDAADLFPSEQVHKFSDVKAIIDEKKGETEEFTAQHKDGTKFPVAVSSSNVTDDKGNIVGRMASFINLTESKQAKKAVKESKEQIRVLSSKLLEAEERERNLIARDLHDVIGSRLTTIKYSLEKEIDVRDSGLSHEKDALERVVSLLQETIKENKRIYRSLRPPILDDLGINKTITWFIRQFQEIYSKISVENHLDVREDNIPEPLKIVIYRVLQEALNNVAKHCGEGNVHVRLTKESGKLHLGIEDDGKGFDIEETIGDENSSVGLGLASMKERVELFNGSYKIHSAKGKGTKINASWPCD
jgi:PAS domain S-box-containing protein